MPALRPVASTVVTLALTEKVVSPAVKALLVARSTTKPFSLYELSVHVSVSCVDVGLEVARSEGSWMPAMLVGTYRFVGNVLPLFSR